MIGESAVTSISERSTYSSIFFRFGLVPSTMNLRKFAHPSLHDRRGLDAVSGVLTRHPEALGWKQIDNAWDFGTRSPSHRIVIYLLSGLTSHSESCYGRYSSMVDERRLV